MTGPFADRIAPLLRGRKALLTAFVSGALTALAVPPVNLVPLWLIALPALILLLEQAAQAGWKRCALLAWLFGVGHFGFALYWVSFSLFTDIAKFWFLVPVVVIGLPVGLALFWAPLGAVWPWLRRRAGPVSRVLAAALILSCLELLRGHAFTGFPWGLAGYGWLGVLPLAQLASVLGVYGLTLLTFTIASLPALFWLGGERIARRSLLAVALALVLVGVWGQGRIADIAALPDRDVRLRLVQPNIQQNQKWDRALFNAHMRNLVRLSGQGGETDLIIWPESAVPFDPSSTPWFPQVMADLPAGSHLMLGAVRAEGAEGSGRESYYNSVQAAAPDGEILATYDKAHLVPFGEYMPLRSVLPLDAIAAGDFDFSAGPGQQSLRFGGLPAVSPLVCYEAIFSGNVIDTSDRPDWLLTVTNDGWFGNSAGPHQHWAMARMRAIEEGLPMVRVANTGISGVIDAAGHVRVRSGLGEVASLNSALPASIGQTVFSSRFLAITVALHLLLFGCATIANFRRNREL